MIVRLLESRRTADVNLDHLKTIIYGGGPMYVEDTRRALDMLGPKLVQIYGQGEAPMTITGLARELHLDTGHPRYLERLGSVGTARTDVEVRIVGPDDEPLPPGETGEVVLRGDVVMKGYWNNPEATHEALRGGWLHTGDLGAMDEDGFVTLKDRSKDMIISGGTNIYPREIEEVLLRHPGVLEASVVGRPHPEWGEEVVAFVVATGAGSASGGTGARRAVPRAHCALQAAPGLPLHRHPAEEQLRKGAQDRAARASRGRSASGLSAEDGAGFDARGCRRAFIP